MAIAQPKRVKEITKSISEGDMEAAATARSVRRTGWLCRGDSTEPAR